MMTTFVDRDPNSGDFILKERFRSQLQPLFQGLTEEGREWLELGFPGVAKLAAELEPQG
jgi:hypothetical protein